jgi:hypothetical protein
MFPKTTPAQLFVACGNALHGEEFAAQLSRALMVDRTTVQKWSTGKSRVPPGVWLELAALIQDREVLLPELKVAVLEAAHPDPEPPAHQGGFQTHVRAMPRRR